MTCEAKELLKHFCDSGKDTFYVEDYMSFPNYEKSLNELEKLGHVTISNNILATVTLIKR